MLIVPGFANSTAPSCMKMDLKEEEFVLFRLNHESYFSYSNICKMIISLEKIIFWANKVICFHHTHTHHLPLEV